MCFILFKKLRTAIIYIMIALFTQQNVIQNYFSKNETDFNNVLKIARGPKLFNLGIVINKIIIIQTKSITIYETLKN